MIIETTAQLIARIQTLPRTHKCVTTYANGEVHEVPAVSESAAKNHAVMKRRLIGRDLKVRGEPGKTVRIVSVEVVAL